jgi:enoyl-CoA hydratase/carnithine racemase
MGALMNNSGKADVEPIAGDSESGRTHPRGLVETHTEASIGFITLNRKGKHNAMTREMWRALPEAVETLSSAPGVASIVIQGADGSFCAGADLSEVLAATRSMEAATEYCTTVVDALLALAYSPKPTIAAMSGVAAGGGAELALATDLRFADESSSLQLPLARIGVVPDDFTLRRLLALGGPAVARLMLFGGESMSASRCLAMGLVDVVTTQGGLDEAIKAHVGAFSTTSPYAIREIKALLIADELGAQVEDLVNGMAKSFVAGDVEKFARRFTRKTST